MEDVAKILNIDPDRYLEILREYDGWYQDLVDTGSTINKGSDVPVPAESDVQEPAQKQRKLSERKKQRKHKRKMTAEQPGPEQPGTHTPALRPRRSARLRPAVKSKAAAMAMAAAVKQNLDADQLWSEYAEIARLEQKGWFNVEGIENGLAHRAESHQKTPKHYRAAHRGKDSNDWTAAEKKEWGGALQILPGYGNSSRMHERDHN